MTTFNFSIQKTIAVLAILFLVVNTGVYSQQKAANTNSKTAVEADFAPVLSPAQGYGPFTKYTRGTAVVTEMVDDYLFPSDISNDGSEVVIQMFGSNETSFYWSEESGLLTIEGAATSISDNGVIAGSFTNANLPGGQTATTAGTYDIAADEWTFLGINPDYPDVTGEDYNDAWGMSNDGQTLVGLQLYNTWSAVAFKWTGTNGYSNIGSSLNYDSRASGISGNGEVIFGWSATDYGNWTPVIWHDETYTLLAPDDGGEAMCASDQGTYVAGVVSESAFYWSEATGTVPFGSADHYPTTILDDGSAFGFVGVFPPENRTAFYLDTDGNLMTFNDYAEARGMEDAQSWTFYSINAATADGNTFIGAAMNPSGQDVSFRIEFIEQPVEYTLNLAAQPQEGGETTGAGNYQAGADVEIEAIANENFDFVNWTDAEGNVVSDQAATTITMPENNTTLTANFQATSSVSDIANDISVFPNPASETILLTNITDNAMVSILDITGQIVYSEQLNAENNVIDVRAIANGIYILVVEEAQGVIHTQKIQILR